MNTFILVLGKDKTIENQQQDFLQNVYSELAPKIANVLFTVSDGSNDMHQWAVENLKFDTNALEPALYAFSPSGYYQTMKWEVPFSKWSYNALAQFVNKVWLAD